jgi:uncharacterized protein involved in exopolysaccharide biosynthesis
MESMDIQIIDCANLPDTDKPSSPKKMFITLIGIIVGCVVAVGYSLFLYKQK